MTERIIADFDIGNGYVKGSAMNALDRDISYIDIPSGIAMVTNMNTHEIKSVDIEAAETVNNIYNKMDVSFESPIIPEDLSRYRWYFGERGIKSGLHLEEFDVSMTESKAKQALSYMLTLGCAAGKALQDYVKGHNALPSETVNANVTIALALPIREYMKYKDEYSKKYVSSRHRVTFHNFEKPITVELAFDNVQVIAEGASAQYAIIAGGSDLMGAMLADLRAQGEPMPGITPDDILAAKHTIGIDIGEGTVNFPVFYNGKFNPDVSSTFNKGYGMVLNDARTYLNDTGSWNFSSRKQLQEYLNEAPSPLQRQRYRNVQAVVNEYIGGFVSEVVAEFSKVWQKVSTFNEVIYVYGGGATAVKPELYRSLIAKIKTNGELANPVMYLDSRYSRFLNRDGLQIMAEAVYRRANANSANTAKAEPEKESKAS